MSRDHVSHAEIVQFANDRVNLPKAKADEYRAQARRLREKLDGYLDDAWSYANRTLLTYISLALVAAWLLIRYLSLGRMILTLIPVLIAVGTTSVVVSVSGFELSPLTTVTGPLVIATCTEFTVLIMMRYLEERRLGLGSEEACDKAAARTGRAFVASALTTVGGFGVLAFSALPLLRDFGVIIALNVAVALLSALIVLPPLLKFADDKGMLRTRRVAAPEPTAEPAPAREPVGTTA